MKIFNIGDWPGEIHTEFEQVKRIESGKKLLKDVVSNPGDGSIQIQGGAEEPYIATLDECTCTDFYFRGKPCKHIYCLAWTMGLLDELPTLKPKKDRQFDPTSEIDRYRELYESGEMSADAYVKICTALSKIKK